MTKNTLLSEQSGYVRRLRLNRPDDNNSINKALLLDLNRELDAAERDERCKVIVIRGVNGVFCTGMDFKEASANAAEGLGERQSERAAAALFMSTMRRISTIPRVVIAAVDGLASAGGIGLVAAADLVVATPRARFSLPEALWGLLPCCVTPYLVRRVGFQNAYRLTLTTLPINGQRAREMNLVDELSEDIDEGLGPIIHRLTRLAPETVGNLKQYFRRMWFMTGEQEELAIDEIARLTASAIVRENIRRFVEHQEFPWDSSAANEEAGAT